MVRRLELHISFSFQMVGNLQIIMLLLFTFVLPVNPIDLGKKLLISMYTSKYRKIKGEVTILVKMYFPQLSFTMTP